MINYYEILGVREQASEAEIKRAFRRLVKIYHPDINDSPEANDKILEITSAYEVLSDPVSKNNYDIQLYDGFQTDYSRPAPVSENELARRAYKKRRAEEEQERVARLFRIKKGFYQLQRVSCYGFLVISIIFSIDFFFKPAFETIKVESVMIEIGDRDQYVSLIHTNSGDIIESERGVYDHFDKANRNSLRVHKSSIFNLDSEIGVLYGDKWLYYAIYGNMHEYGNIFAYIIMIISLVIIRQKEYADWALTIAMVPFFISLFLFMLLT